MSFKLDRTKLIIFAVICVVFVSVLIIASPKTEEVNAPKPKDVTIKTEEDRLNFIKSFGWEVQTEPVEVMEMIVPTEFDNVYNQYNYIQKLQGYDLLRFKGKRIKRWTYRVTNYPGKPNETVNINILIYNEKVIGGDVGSTALGGFIHGLEMQGDNSDISSLSGNTSKNMNSAGKSSISSASNAKATGQIGSAVTYGLD